MKGLGSGGSALAENLEQAAFPIAGVGASAGGLAATTELLRHLGSRPGAGIVVVHHLDPTHESHHVDILSRVTSLPVEAAHDGRRVEPNHVYVVPPNARLAIEGGALRLKDQRRRLCEPQASNHMRRGDACRSITCRAWASTWSLRLPLKPE